MGLLEALAAALEMPAADVMAKLGVAEGAEEAAVAKAIYGFVTVEPVVPAEVAVNAAVAGLLGVEADASEEAVKASILTLQARTDATDICDALSLKPDAEPTAILQAITALRNQSAGAEAEIVVGAAVAEGKIVPAQKAFWLNAAVLDIGAARAAINAMSIKPAVKPEAGATGAAEAGGARALTGVEKAVCASLRLSPAEYLASVKGA